MVARRAAHRSCVTAAAMAAAAAVHHHTHTKHGGADAVEEVGFGAKRKQNQFKQENISKLVIPEKARKHVVSSPACEEAC